MRKIKLEKISKERLTWKKRRKKRWYQRWWVWVIIVFLAIGIFAPVEEETAKETEEVEAEETKEEAQEKEKKNNEDNEKKEEKEEVKTSESATSEPVDNDQSNNEAQEALEQMALGVMEESFAGLAEVSFDRDSKLYTITPTDPAFEQELVMMNEGILGQEEWDILVENFAFMSDSAKGLIGNGYSIALINPSNSDKYLLMITDGKVEYDAFNE